MANPTPYVPGYSYSDFQTSQPTTPLPAPQIDNDFASIQQTTDETIAALADVRRSDGALKNGVVTPDSLSPEALADLVPAATALAEQYRDEAAASAAAAAASETDAEEAAGLAVASAAGALVSENAANTLVQQAVSGFVGFVDGLGYDFGSITAATTYFDQDWGSV